MLPDHRLRRDHGGFFRNAKLAGGVAVASVVLATGIAIALVPADPRAEIALWGSAVALTIGLLAVPFFRLFSNITVAARAENVLSLGLVYWLLLDLMQGLYSLDVSQ